MLKIADVTVSADSFLVSGDLDFNNVVPVYEKACARFADFTSLVFDFSGVTSSSSAGLALVVEWIKQAKLQHKPITFNHLSDDILSLAVASGLDELITGRASPK